MCFYVLIFHYLLNYYNTFELSLLIGKVLSYFRLLLVISVPVVYFFFHVKCLQFNIQLIINIANARDLSECSLH